MLLVTISILPNISVICFAQRRSTISCQGPIAGRAGTFVVIRYTRSTPTTGGVWSSSITRRPRPWPRSPATTMSQSGLAEPSAGNQPGACRQSTTASLPASKRPVGCAAAWLDAAFTGLGAVQARQRRPGAQKNQPDRGSRSRSTHCAPWR